VTAAQVIFAQVFSETYVAFPAPVKLRRVLKREKGTACALPLAMVAQLLSNVRRKAVQIISVSSHVVVRFADAFYSPCSLERS
jgi:hypothetical protein